MGSDDGTSNEVGVQICPQCRTPNHKTDSDTHTIKCIECQTDIRILEDVTNPSPETPTSLASTNSTASLKEAVHQYNQHALECEVCRTPMKSYLRRIPRCVTGFRIAEPIRDEFEQQRQSRISKNMSRSIRIAILGVKGYCLGVVDVLNTILQAEMESAHESDIRFRLNKGDSSRADRTEETIRFTRIFTVKKKLNAPSKPEQRQGGKIPSMNTLKQQSSTGVSSEQSADLLWSSDIKSFNDPHLDVPLEDVAHDIEQNHDTVDPEELGAYPIYYYQLEPVLKMQPASPDPGDEKEASGEKERTVSHRPSPWLPVDNQDQNLELAPIWVKTPSFYHQVANGLA
ncbi:hypothetical protein BJ508DRAFT_307364 [Ascobolus immersus RN42]|uniref:Uncharacterized protein n=1 Tax=Ascobolus immersus RN42 TaxID=1160509 RepID=A0A3N4I8U5_ASCIM|nr:hypothetical protein BJ508DRAFT_307364 [Ascobolus immersus RN42]